MWAPALSAPGLLSWGGGKSGGQRPGCSELIGENDKIWIFLPLPFIPRAGLPTVPGFARIDAHGLSGFRHVCAAVRVPWPAAVGFPSAA